MKKKYILAFFTFIAFISVIISCSDDDEYVPVEDKLPVATDDSASYALLSNVNINVTSNDTSGDQVVITSVNLVGGIDTDGNGTLDNLIVLGEGTWVVNSVTGVITFTPISTFLGNPTPIKYYVKDAQGNNSNQATITVVATSTVNANLDQVPCPKLSDYGFFAGEMKNQIPSLKVLPYEPASTLFTDYAHKKRFIWMPNGVKATFNGDTNILELPVGAVLIKNFYYDNVQNVVLAGATRIIETRIMIRKATGWIFAEYVWNNEQTEAFLNMNGSTTSITWIDEENNTKTVPEYRIPNEVQCIICHKSQETINGVFTTKYIPIAIKPQNLNFQYNYGTETVNQLTKWIQIGYLDSNFSLPSTSATTIDYRDVTKSLDLRVRSYLDINCAHCHQNNRHCDYRPMRFAYSETGASNGLANLGVCVNTVDMQNFAPALGKIITPGNINRSMLYHRLNTNDEAYRMPLHGRTVIHTEAVNMIGQWINTLQPCP